MLNQQSEENVKRSLIGQIEIEFERRLGGIGHPNLWAERKARVLKMLPHEVKALKGEICAAPDKHTAIQAIIDGYLESERARDAEARRLDDDADDVTPARMEMSVT